ncbi:hypothetical protein [Nitrobacter sp.]|uniref:hypothetical protein n=1 Tax=Nitrobacter sp. TaxID=29420 RepID=UPI0029CAC4B1|nr:hypothetical protein [Nitrobacter sp.]
MFDAELVTIMRGALAQAALEVCPDSSTQVLMAERILQSAAKGTRSQEAFRIIATEAAAESERLRLLNPPHSRHAEQSLVDHEDEKEFW